MQKKEIKRLEIVKDCEDVKSNTITPTKIMTGLGELVTAQVFDMAHYGVFTFKSRLCNNTSIQRQEVVQQLALLDAARRLTEDEAYSWAGETLCAEMAYYVRRA